MLKSVFDVNIFDMKKKLIWIGSIFIIIVGIVLIICSRSKEPVYQLAKVEIGDVTQIVSVTGAATSAKEADLQFENSGKIKEIAVEVGSRVLAGDILIKLDTAELNAQLISNQAALAIAQAQLDQTLAGNRLEDIQVYETDVVSAKVSLENKKQALIDAADDTENDLRQAYEDADDILNDAYNKASDAVYKQVDDLFTNDNVNPQLTFNIFNATLENAVESARLVAAEELSALKNELMVLDIQNQETTDEELTKAKGHLYFIRDFLADAMNVLNNAANLTASDLSSYKSGVTTARTNINTALTNIVAQEQSIAAVKIANQISVNVAQAAVDTAQAALKSAQDKLVLKKAAPIQADVDLAKAKVRQAQANVLQIQEKINKAVLRAPIGGFITAISKEVGEMAQPSDIIISIIAADHFQIEANVSETEIAKIKLEDQIKMTLDALDPDEKFTGKIIKIDPAETVISGVIYYKITSAFDIKDERIKSGMTANLEIQTDRKENVLFLPYYAIYETNGRQYVKMLSDDGKIIEKDVRTGLEGEVSVEITEGLEVGQQVIVFSEE